MQGKVLELKHGLKESEEHREGLKDSNQRLEREIAALRLTQIADTQDRDNLIVSKDSSQN